VGVGRFVALYDSGTNRLDVRAGFEMPEGERLTVEDSANPPPYSAVQDVAITFFGSAVSGLDGGFNLETTHFRSELANDDETVEVELTVSLTPRHLPTDAQPR
jgi:hypothetical protein